MSKNPPLANIDARRRRSVAAADSVVRREGDMYNTCTCTSTSHTVWAECRAHSRRKLLTSLMASSLSRSNSSQKIPQRVHIPGRSAGTWSEAAESSVPLHSWIKVEYLPLRPRPMYQYQHQALISPLCRPRYRGTCDPSAWRHRALAMDSHSFNARPASIYQVRNRSV